MSGSSNSFVKVSMLVRIKATGQVLDMVPAVAVAMLNGGTAEAVVQEVKRETATLAHRVFEKAAKFIGAR
ncbi:Uncharacterised protein [uncultured archaeon]|nr:Uncharacterised protein [uncultured archaeon]